MQKAIIFVGDVITLKLIDASYGGAAIDLEIGGISVQYLNQEIYCTFPLLESKGIALEADTALLQIDSKDNIPEAYTALGGMDGVLEIKTLADLRAATEQGLKNLFSMIIIIIICAAILCAAAIYNISVINIQERTRELATLKVLGSQNKCINTLIFKENVFLTVFAIIIGIPTGLIIYQNVLKIFTIDSMSFPVYITIGAFVWPMLITLVITVLSSMFLQRKVNRIDMIESLKVNE